MPTVAYKELESLLCTVFYGLIAAPSARVYLRRPFAALRKAGSSAQRHDDVRVSEELSHDLLAIRDRFRLQKGALFAPAKSIGRSDINAGATDASRSPGGYSGMGGICFKAKRYWWYRLGTEHSKLPIHITEFVAELIQMALYQSQWDDGYTEFVDNMAVVQSIRQGKPRDWRLLELLLMRHHLSEAGGVFSSPLYIKSKDNRFADALSRGKFEEFRAELRAARLHGFAGTDLNALKTDAVTSLLDRMMDMFA